ncbi:Hydrogen peroxide-inducible gene activator [Pseudodesulfovibrio hydrargyri]|uniref:Hydrogen peroxide-inducible gene activator n=1 Tax=Pseudodesulfovibrio hydrargyri TaxID=2125990 RepID=A0A1J5N0G5_9BACT|nr:LysR family transcriptional regulator [Pseudodesulfovibrio hydrargyri]OIQ52285.1 Hydrogen peroxide-inducible gene activator [Pseudodesulfovibrio hydrargyri]
MELYQLVSFVAVAEEGNMTRAASRLNMSQPAVSAQIKALEEELGISLFWRTPQGMDLTKGGERLKDRADIILRDVDAFRNEAEKARGGGRGSIALGVNTDPRLLRLKNVHSLLAKEFPEIFLVVKETMSWDVASELSSRNIDLGFSYTLPDDDRIEAQSLGEIELSIVASEAWRERLGAPGLKELASFPWVWTSDHCPMNKVLSGLFKSIGEEPVKAVVVDQESAILRLVADEVGLGIMPALKVEDVSDAYGIFSVMNLEKKLTLHLLSLERRADEPMIAAMVSLIREVWS